MGISIRPGLVNTYIDVSPFSRDEIKYQLLPAFISPTLCYHQPNGSTVMLLWQHSGITLLKPMMIYYTALSGAEGMGRKFIEAGGAGIWGVLGIMFNENRIEKAKKAAILAWWESKWREELLYPDFRYKDFRLGTEWPCINSFAPQSCASITVFFSK